MNPLTIRVLVVDDSLVFRTKLEQSLSADSRVEVVGTAVNAIDAMKKIDALQPDVITLDVEMPHMNGIDFLKKLIPQKPIPVIVVSSLPINVLDALSAGAVDFIKKPVVNKPEDMSNFISELLAKIKIAKTAKVHPLPKKIPAISPAHQISAKKILHNNPNSIVAIGASTGGTEAIIEVVKNLPKNTPGVIIVQHMPPVFTNMYAQRLDRICQMSAKEAEDNDRVETGKILVAAGDYHMRLCKDSKGYYIRSQKGPRVNGHCPSVDVLFESVAEVAGKNALAVILTGMGADGAKGLLKIRNTGAYTIGQDKASCVVYGMPMEAYKLGAVAKQLPLEKICEEIILKLS